MLAGFLFKRTSRACFWLRAPILVVELACSLSKIRQSSQIPPEDASVAAAIHLRPSVTVSAMHWYLLSDLRSHDPLYQQENNWQGNATTLLALQKLDGPLPANVTPPYTARYDARSFVAPAHKFSDPAAMLRGVLEAHGKVTEAKSDDAVRFLLIPKKSSPPLASAKEPYAVISATLQNNGQLSVVAVGADDSQRSIAGLLALQLIPISFIGTAAFLVWQFNRFDDLTKAFPFGVGAIFELLALLWLSKLWVPNLLTLLARIRQTPTPSNQIWARSEQALQEIEARLRLDGWTSR